MSGGLFDIGLSGLRASQAGLSVAGQNITNAGTEGYSRQRVETSSLDAHLYSSGLTGLGVDIDRISRLTNEYAIRQERQDTSATAALTLASEELARLDQLISTNATALTPAIESFFSAMNSAAAAPDDIAGRSLVLAEAESLATRFRAVGERITDQSADLTGRIESSVSSINRLSTGIAELNARLAGAQHADRSGQLNGLLDKRDQLLLELSEQVNIATVEDSSGRIDVFVGKGQALVLGSVRTEMGVNPIGEVVVFPQGQVELTVDSTLLTGGRLGGLVQLRDGVLQDVRDALGRLSLRTTTIVNEAHSRGIDLEGQPGGDLFADANLATRSQARVRFVGDSRQDAAQLDVNIRDVSQLQLTDYELVVGDQGFFTITRGSDRELLATGDVNASLPATYEFDGIDVVIRSGNLLAGDRFLIEPLRNEAAATVALAVDPSALAFGLPVRASPSLGNVGNAVAVVPDIEHIDHALLAEAGKVMPPLMIRFIDDDHYDVLDATDPANPVPLASPLAAIRHTPGTGADAIPGGTGSTLVASSGENVGALPSSASPLGDSSLADNGYASEQVSIIDAQTGELQSFVMPANATAKEFAASLNAMRGVSAYANTELTLADLVHNDAGADLTFYVNEQRFVLQPGESLGELADAINEFEWGSSIVARSDGTSLTLRSLEGENLSVGLHGDVSESVTLRDINGGELTLRGSGQGEPASVTGSRDMSLGYDFSSGGPYSLAIAVNGGAPTVVSLSGNYASSAALTAGLQAEIDAALGGTVTSVSLNASDQLQLASTVGGADASITISQVSAGMTTATGLVAGMASGEDDAVAATVGGALAVVLAEGLSLNSDDALLGGNVFESTPDVVSLDFGFDVVLEGTPRSTDRFLLEFNSGGVGDNRNALALSRLQDGTGSGVDGFNITGEYARIIELVGFEASQANINSDAAQTLLEQSRLAKESVSGVNLDEEAAQLIELEQAYNASARLITVARDLIDILLGATA